jgi:Family of unknown function (DUF5685)
MFGLLKHRPHEPGQRADFRKSYCGTCKAIGKIYGHKERLLLNYDVVFLSELLAALSNNHDDFAAISVGRCFSLPAHLSQVPDFLTYTASVNMLLAGIKVKDNIEDSGYKAFAWQALAWLQEARFAKSRRLLDQFGLGIEYVEEIVSEQLRRERARLHFADVASACRYYAEMTGLLTGEIFRQSAATAGRPESASLLYEVGKAYGEIVYLADAVKDYEKDYKVGAFNPLLTVSDKPAAVLLQQSAEVVHQQIAANLLIIRNQLFQLPIAEEKKQLFAARMETAVNGVFQPSGSCATARSCRVPRITLSEKYRMIYKRAKLALTPANPQTLKLAGAALLASLFALFMLVLPLRVDASTPAPPPGGFWEECANECCSDCCDSCCQSCCDSICEEICN